MAKKFPEIAESSEALLERMQKEKHVLKRQRLHTLYLVKSGQVGSRQAIAHLLGVGGNAVGQWLNDYARAGLDELLEVKVPPGRVATLNPAQQAHLREALARPTGFGSFVEVQGWIQEQWGIRMEYSAVHKLVKYYLGASLKVARPTHPQKTSRRLSSSVTP
jgi:transposase